MSNPVINKDLLLTCRYHVISVVTCYRWKWFFLYRNASKVVVVVVRCDLVAKQPRRPSCIQMSIRFCRNCQSNPFIETLGKQPLGTITGQNTRVIKAFYTEGDILKLSEICMWHVTASHVATFSVWTCGEKCRSFFKDISVHNRYSFIDFKVCRLPFQSTVF